MNEEEKRALQLDYQLVQETIRQLNKELTLLDQQIRAMQLLDKNLEDLKTAKKGSEVFAEIGSGVFIKTTLQDTADVIVNAGANTVVTKPLEDTRKMIEEQIEQLKEAILKTEMELQRCAMQAQFIHKKFVESKKHNH